jgi:hypothetical protein
MSGDIADVLGHDFDTVNVPPAKGFDPIPAGWYPLEIEKAELRDTKAGTGKYLWSEMTVLGEKYAGRKLFVRITLVNPNSTAEEIGQRQLASLGLACGLKSVGSTDDLLGKVVEGRVKITKEKEKDREPDNDIAEYRAIGGQQPAQTAAPQQRQQAQSATPTQQPDPAATGKRPWE